MQHKMTFQVASTELYLGQKENSIFLWSLKICNSWLAEGKETTLVLHPFPESPQSHFDLFDKCNPSFETQLIAYKEIFNCCFDNVMYQHYILPCWLVNCRLDWQAEFSRWDFQMASWTWQYGSSGQECPHLYSVASMSAAVQTKVR